MLIADSGGRISGSFLIPMGVPVGTRRVEFKGSGGSTAAAQYTGYGWTDIETRQQVVTTTTTWIDPLGQLIIDTTSRFITGVDIEMKKIGDPKKPVIVQIRNGLPTGPGNEIFAEARLSGDDLRLGRLSFTFERMVFMQADTLYGIVILTDDPDHEVAVAKLGGFDSREGYGWMRTKPYPPATFFSGADARTWLPHPDMALTFWLRGARFTATKRKISVGTLPVDRISDILPVVLAVRPEGTDIEVEVTTPTGQRYTVAPNATVELPAYITGDIEISLVFTGTETLSPVLLQRDIQVVLGTIAQECDYVSRAMKSDANSRFTFVGNAYLTGDASVKVEAQTAVADGSPVWTVVPLNGNVGLGDNIFELEHRLAPFDADMTRLKLTLRGGPANRVWVKGPTCVVTADT